jgi:hypothetical protein
MISMTTNKDDIPFSPGDPTIAPGQPAAVAIRPPQIHHWEHQRERRLARQPGRRAPGGSQAGLFPRLSDIRLSPKAGTSPSRTIEHAF